MTRLSLDAIKIISTIKSTGSFSMAAEALHKTPSAISYRVSNIESKLCVKLFHRNGPMITLTDEGEFLLQEGSWILNAVQDLESRVRNIPKLDNNIRIVVDKFFPLETITQDIRDYIQHSPNANISVQREALNGTWDALKNNRADLIIAIGQIPDSVQAKTLMLGKLNFVLCVSPSHPFAAQKKPVDKNQRLNDIVVVIADSSHELPKRNHGTMPLQRQLVVCDVESKLALLKRGIGHGFLPPSLIEKELASGELVTVPVDMQKGDEMIWLAWHPASKGTGFTWWHERLTRKSDVFSLMGREVIRDGGYPWCNN
ncbi:LysR family transcriptional regulator [Serratia plymuthica]|jgi:DNA-binding transcriptional LysR family regulator|uniref:HTH-type transcriptional activator AllS n=2 Tax=Serratia plymuthica TaxID=82996 RepID=A0A2X4UWW1_SERPL|nr:MULTISPECIES: LysR family transcriptional regulator [Serratia]AEF46777.1 transcriptional regulator, LysR family [Serratia plymuthica AS9]AEF51729.1 transcriptional regulator, LysR family [Serratia sp. AS12]AEG29436.1 transcriptional regulator, LysR family [Serratia sp. AS13]AGO56353.1 putative HTH-type transcriptional regulator YeeY [Serratia plymuthica 4Rx13]AGP45487.1 LysR family transcriptional regulator [Serratia plymuthica S13]